VASASNASKEIDRDRVKLVIETPFDGTAGENEHTPGYCFSEVIRLGNNLWNDLKLQFASVDREYANTHHGREDSAADTRRQRVQRTVLVQGKTTGERPT